MCAGIYRSTKLNPLSIVALVSDAWILVNVSDILANFCFLLLSGLVSNGNQENSERTERFTECSWLNVLNQVGIGKTNSFSTSIDLGNTFDVKEEEIENSFMYITIIDNGSWVLLG